MLTVEAVLFVRVTVWLLWLPTVTLPKLSLAGLAPSRPLATPVPVSDTVAELSEALLVTVTVALKVPAALGLKTKLTGMLWPAIIAAGRVGALNEKYWLEIDALLSVMEAVLVLDAVNVNVLLVPAVTLPKLRLAPLRDRVPACTCCVAADLLELKPWQPTIVARQRSTIPSWLRLSRLTAPIV